MKERDNKTGDKLSRKKFWIRAAVAIALVALAAAAFTYGIVSLFSAETGYTTLESTAGYANCSSDFVFTYRLGVSGVSPTAEKKALTTLYSERTVYYYRLFHPTQVFDEVNLAKINKSVNKDVTVPLELYKSLETAAADPGRNLYLGPIYAYYETLFSSSYDEDAATWDPARNEDLRAEFQRALAFIGSDEHVRVELKGDGKVRLFVSKAYLAFAEETGVTAFVDFTWLKNAFIADLLTEDFLAAGYDRGVLSSRDGFIRNFDRSETEYGFDFFYEKEGSVHSGKRIVYTGRATLVTLHGFALDDAENALLYEYADGTRVTRYLSTEDALSHDASGAVTAFSRDVDCADLALELLPYYTEDRLADYAPSDAGLIWFDGTKTHTRSLEGFTLKD